MKTSEILARSCPAWLMVVLAEIRLIVVISEALFSRDSATAGAYTIHPCYGRPLGTAPDNLQPTPRTLTSDEIDAVIGYLKSRIIGRGRITREECLAYYENQADCCEDYR